MNHEANKIIVDILKMIERQRLAAYLEATGWQADWADEAAQIYRLKMPDRSIRLTLPVDTDWEQSLSTVQNSLERLAIAEKTTFVGIVCKILEVEQLVLKPPV